MSTPSDVPFELHLPPGTKDLYLKRISEIPADKRTQWRFHRVVSGETLATIARDYHVSSSEIVFVNQLQAGDDLSSGDSLVIPVAPPLASKARVTMYKVAHGDTLVTVADRFDVTVQQLRRWNHLTAAKVAPGTRLYVAEPARVSRSVKTHHTVSGKKAADEKASAASTAHKSRAPASTRAAVKTGSATALNQ